MRTVRILIRRLPGWCMRVAISLTGVNSRTRLRSLLEGVCRLQVVAVHGGRLDVSHGGMERLKAMGIRRVEGGAQLGCKSGMLWMQTVKRRLEVAELDGQMLQRRICGVHHGRNDDVAVLAGAGPDSLRLAA